MRLQLSGLWFKDSKNGQTYLTGSIDSEKIKELISSISNEDKVFISIFPNSYKEDGDRKPDWVLYINTAEDTNSSKSKPISKPMTKSIERMGSNVVSIKAKYAVDESDEW